MHLFKISKVVSDTLKNKGYEDLSVFSYIVARQMWMDKLIKEVGDRPVDPRKVLTILSDIYDSTVKILNKSDTEDKKAAYALLLDSIEDAMSYVKNSWA